MTMGPCSSWRRNPNGSWTSIGPWQFGGVSGGAGVTVTRGVSMSGVDIAAWLDANCG
jgi:hypothetical protein